MSKLYVITYTDQDGENHSDVHGEMQSAQKNAVNCFKSGYDGIMVYEAVEMELSINVSLTAKKELPF